MLPFMHSGYSPSSARMRTYAVSIYTLSYQLMDAALYFAFLAAVLCSHFTVPILLRLIVVRLQPLRIVQHLYAVPPQLPRRIEVCPDGDIIKFSRGNIAAVQDIVILHAIVELSPEHQSPDASGSETRERQLCFVLQFNVPHGTNLNVDMLKSLHGGEDVAECIESRADQRPVL